MAKIGGASGALTTPSNINLQRLNAGAIKNSSPFIQTEQQTDIVFQTLNGVVASEPIDFDPKSASNSMCDNLVIEAGTQSAKFKQLLYYSSDKSREITPLTRDFLKLSKGSQAEQNQYKLGLVQLAHGVGGGRIIYDETKFPIKPQLGDSITLQAVLGDLAYPSKIIEVQQTPEIITPPEKQEGERKPEEASSPPAAPKGGGGGGTPTAATSLTKYGASSGLNEQQVTRTVYIIDALIKELGYEDFQAAGLVGNFLAESGLVPDTIEIKYRKKYAQPVGSCCGPIPPVGGYGWAQWTQSYYKSQFIEFTKKEFNIDLRKQNANDEINLKFLIFKLNNGGDKGRLGPMSERIKKAKNIESATKEFLYTFERPLVICCRDDEKAKIALLNYRTSRAEQALKAYRKAKGI